MKDSQHANNNNTLWYKRLLSERVIWEYSGAGPHARDTLNENHSDFYINSDYLNCNPQLVKELAQALFEKVTASINIKPEWLLTYPPFGAPIGFSLASLFGSKFACLKSLQEPYISVDINKGETVLLCADDITSGTCMRKLLAALENKVGKVIAPIVVIANLSGKPDFNNLPIASLIEREVNVWKKESCPLCAAGSPAISARDNWQIFTKQTPERPQDNNG